MVQNSMNKRKMQKRLDLLVQQGLGEWLLRNVSTAEEAAAVVDYEGQLRKRCTTVRARLQYHGKRMRCIAQYRREGRDRHAGALLHSSSTVVSLGTTEIPVHTSQSIVQPGTVYRVTGQHRSDVTGGWRSVLDCDVVGSSIRCPVVPSTPYQEFDDLAVMDPA